MQRIGVPCHIGELLSKPLGPRRGRMDHILPGDPPVPVSLRRSARARRLSLRISGTDGRVTLTLPLRARLGDTGSLVDPLEKGHRP